jgi:hypothetical protein
VVQERIAKSRKSSQEPTKVGGKRKPSGSAGAKGSDRSSKPKLGANAKMSNEQYQKDMAEKLCHICYQPDHIARNCPQNKKAKKGKGGKVAADVERAPQPLILSFLIPDKGRIKLGTRDQFHTKNTFDHPLEKEMKNSTGTSVQSTMIY